MKNDNQKPTGNTNPDKNEPVRLPTDFHNHGDMTRQKVLKYLEGSTKPATA